MFTTWHKCSNKMQKSLLALFCLLALTGQVATDQHIHVDSSDTSECLICGHGDQASALNQAILPVAFRGNGEVSESFHSSVTPIGLRYYPTRAPPRS
ncbi:MAG: hypothetical protein HOL98_16445 [Gammaproteobacteria bacterium]|nr:hypothetical protein [Gammaproteobacteria bacterium]MBT5205051.1 hypothetical protein [Gammaproteobacteria bacterium]MBT5600916.1 hypothetical protein [Gammaproteobacteria bacterium]MBT6244428.1 hypothetical protein [Gammaproteobacteria bacterium]